ncbi:hypothetical protein [Olivibacter ginsenosidimutans]
MFLPLWWVVVLELLMANVSAQQQQPIDQVISTYKSEKLFDFDANDSVRVSISLLKNTKDEPQLYTAFLSTGVCSDGLCKPVNIQLYWGLLGNFYTYQTPEGQGLTKFDHEPFSPKDHRMLHTILADTSSLLRDYYVEDLIDPNITRSSKTLDGVTGATNTNFKDASVPGALYTVYTLWHFVNGSIRHRLLAHTASMLSDTLIRQLLTSDNSAYQRFMIAHLTEQQAITFQRLLIELIHRSKDEYVPHFALDKLPQKTWQDPKLYNQFVGFLPEVSLPVQTAILTKLTNTPVDTKGSSLLQHYLQETKPSDVQQKLIKEILNNRN